MSTPPFINFNRAHYYNTQQAENTEVPGTISYIQIEGKLSPGDGDGNFYFRVDSEPLDDNKIRTADRFLSDGVTIDNLNGGWWIGADKPSALPVGGNTGQILVKSSDDDGDAEWVTGGSMPAGGSTGQIIIKNSNTDYDAYWANNSPPITITYSNKTQAETGTANNVVMSPLRTADAIKGYPFPVYSGGNSRTIIDRSRDWIIANDFSDGTGSPSNDTAALQAALDYAQTDYDKGILVTRPFSINATLTIPWQERARGVRLSGCGQNSIIKPVTNLTTMIDINHKPFTIERIRFPCTNYTITNVISIGDGSGNMGGANQMGTIRDNGFEDISGRCINMNYHVEYVQILNNHVRVADIFIRLNGWNTEITCIGNLVHWARIGLQSLRVSGSIGNEGVKYIANSHLGCVISIYSNASYMFYICDNMFGNHIGNGNGIWFDNGTYANNSNRVMNNFIGGDWQGQFGIVATGTGSSFDGNIFTGNEITLWNEACFALGGSSNYSGNTLRDNTFRSNIGSGTPAQASVVFTTAPRSLVKNNYIAQASGTSMILGGTSTGSIYGNNAFVGGASGVSVGGSGWSSEGANR